MPATNSQSPRGRRARRRGVPLEQRHVPGVRLPEHVGDVADERHQRRSARSIADVEQHPQLHDPRHAHAGAPARRSRTAMSAVTRSPAHGTSPTIGSQPKRRRVPGTRNASSSSAAACAAPRALRRSSSRRCARSSIGHCSGPRSEPPAQQHRADREAGADRRQQHEIALLQPPDARPHRSAPAESWPPSCCRTARC